MRTHQEQLRLGVSDWVVGQTLSVASSPRIPVARVQGGPAYFMFKGAHTWVAWSAFPPRSPAPLQELLPPQASPTTIQGLTSLSLTQGLDIEKQTEDASSHYPRAGATCQNPCLSRFREK